MWVQQSEQISGSKISFEPRAEEDRSISESRIYVEPRAEEEQNHSKPRAEEERNITSNLVRKRKEVIESAKTLNLARTGEQSISMLKFPNLVRKGEGISKLSNDSNLKQKTAYEIPGSDWSSDVCSSDLEEERDTTSNLVRKRKEVIKSAETLNLADRKSVV